MYQLPTCSSRAHASIAGVGIEPPSPTTSSSERLVARQVHAPATRRCRVLGLGQQLLERLEPLHQLLEALVRDRRGLRGERRGERVVEALDVLVLLRQPGCRRRPCRRAASSAAAAGAGSPRRARRARPSRSADQIRSAAARFIVLRLVAAAADLTAVVASTSAQTWNRNSRTPSCTGTSLSILRSSIVYWIAIVSRCSTCCASETPFFDASFSFLK